MESTDYSEFKDLDEDSTMAQLTKLAEAQLLAEDELAKAEANVLTCKKQLEEIAERQIPDLMESVGIETFTIAGGRTISIKEKIQASIPKDTEAKAFKWIRKIGSGKMIKHILAVQLAMGEDELAEKITKAIKEEKPDLDIKDAEAIHASTLRSFVTRRLKAGEEVPMDLITVLRQKRSVIA